MAIKQCVQCGKEFACTMETGHCWCFAYKVDEAALKQLNKQYTDCLCPDCLKQYEILPETKRAKNKAIL